MMVMMMMMMMMMLSLVPSLSLSLKRVLRVTTKKKGMIPIIITKFSKEFSSFFNGDPKQFFFPFII